MKFDPESWITHGYCSYKTKSKKGNCKELHKKYLYKCFKNKGIDLNLISSGQHSISELFWQNECLRHWILSIAKYAIKTNLLLAEDLADLHRKIDAKKKN